jgi:hypothetical protein
MAKRKPEEATDAAPTESHETGPVNESPASTEDHTAEAPTAKSKWAPRFGIFGDYEAGVRLIEDRQNRRMTIKFEEKPSDAVRAVLKSKENGYRFDAEDQLWYKPINQAKPRQSREEAEELAYTVADMIRVEKGLPKKKEASIAM